MPHKARMKSNTEIYHIIIRGNNQENVFQDEVDKKHFIKLVQKFLEDTPHQIYAYCLMSNHLHLMIKISFQEMSLFMNRLSATYAIYYNKKYNRSGHVFQGRFHSECIETESYFWRCLRYIHNNPVKIHLVTQPHQYSYSSAKEYYYNAYFLLAFDLSRLCSKKFKNYTEFWVFHQKPEHELFLDTQEDNELCKKEIFTTMLSKYLAENQLENIETLMANKTQRHEFVHTISKNLKISLNEVKRLLLSKRDRGF